MTFFFKFNHCNLNKSKEKNKQTSSHVTKFTSNFNLCDMFLFSVSRSQLENSMSFVLDNFHITYHARHFLFKQIFYKIKLWSVFFFLRHWFYRNRMCAHSKYSGKKTRREQNKQRHRTLKLAPSTTCTRYTSSVYFIFPWCQRTCIINLFFYFLGYTSLCCVRNL